MPPHVTYVGGAGFKGNSGACAIVRSYMMLRYGGLGLSRYALYYAGIVDESQLDGVLELHKRDTVSTFGTRSSRRVTKKTPTKTATNYR